MSYLSHVILATAIGSISLTADSCVKKKDTIAKVTVLDQDNNRVSGATVQLIGEPSTGTTGHGAVNDPKVTTTNDQGEATFNYNDIYQLGQCGVAVFTIKASLGGAVGNGIIKVEQQKTNEERVFL
ncbi:hypothetical protein [Fluviicola taffensis]|uniref:Putative outer membrane adhesin like protein n=1 Tax=Fluviicola taffensis (strain DSM 16823 / NCIMB 13979 / RW262) TaxID=755732 RepID=F2ICU4_FLUTR|nr:hypothetical protein [Fluviicola taffensis]AEA43318.1 putative outer membrane adhesin like protein [Fluviicola taffensis DSM 16823]